MNLWQVGHFITIDINKFTTWVDLQMKSDYFKSLSGFFFISNLRIVSRVSGVQKYNEEHWWDQDSSLHSLLEIEIKLFGSLSIENFMGPSLCFVKCTNQSNLHMLNWQNVLRLRKMHLRRAQNSLFKAAFKWDVNHIHHRSPFTPFCSSWMLFHHGDSFNPKCPDS